MTIADHRLPRTAIPSHYDLRIEPDLEALTFAGTVGIDIELVEPTDRIVLNAVDLTVVAASVSRDDRTWDADVSLDETHQRVILGLAETLHPGPGRVELSFSGELNDHLHGFYRATYKGEDGGDHVLATTQFESTDARRAFPCWDEPDLKATFSVTLVVAEGLEAVSNYHEVSRRRVDGERVEIRFATTMVMSTYLVAFVVGDLRATEPVDVDGVPLRVVHVPGKEHLTSYALEAGAAHLRYLQQYYGIPYPADKLDLIGIPDFTWGAMENLGAITFRESDLLIDPDLATQAELNRVADVIAHEIAHMWFGDLVTMTWWNGVWLNEAFATFMEAKAVDAYRPDWRRWLTFGLERSASMDIDALATTRPVEFPVESPEEANAMFDDLTYGKGASVVRMLEVYLGEDTFRRGVTDYLVSNAYGNSETADLWSALERVSGEPIGDIMHSWIFEGGHPLLVIERDGDGYSAEQHHFRYIGDGTTRWTVPTVYSTTGGVDRILLGTHTDFSAPGELVMNHGGQGFYRVQYDPELMADVAERLPELSAEEQYVIIDDAFALVLRGDLTSTRFLDLLPRLVHSDQPVVWSAMLRGLNELDRVVPSDVRPELQRFVRELVGVRIDELGWNPHGHESDLDRQLRGMLLHALGHLGAHHETVEAARDVFEQFSVNPEHIDNEIAAAAIALVAGHGDLDEFELFVDRYHGSISPQDRNRYLRAAVAIPHEDAAHSMLEMLADGRFRRQEATGVIARLLGHRDTGATSWRKVRDNWETMLSYPPPQNVRRILDLVHFRSEPDVAADIKRWVEANPIPGADKHVAQQLERLDVRVRFRERQQQLDQIP